MVRAEGIEPSRGVAPNGFSYQLRLSPPPRTAFVVWTIPSPWRDHAVGAARLVSTPSHVGLARDCHLTGFPEFEQFCVSGFPRAHSIEFKSVASTVPPRPRTIAILAGHGVLAK